jgi:ABC-type antimicrobial peptide transport system permease subunit
MVGMVTRRGILLSALGIVIGVPLTLLVHQGVLNAMSLFDADPGYGTALSAGVVLGTVAALASYFPARGAARVQPTRALSLE